MKHMDLIDTNLLNEVSRQAEENPRLRMNYNFHKTLDAKAQRLLNALEPGTILPIHRHPLAGIHGIHIPAGQWHTLEVLERGSVIFEVKDGPYTPLGKENIMEI